MTNKKTKIVIDADVIIHFIKGGYLSILHCIYPQYDYIILSIVLDEVRKHSDTRVAIDNHISLLKTLKVVEWNPKGEMIRDFAVLTDKESRGEGESACMIYCKYNNDVVASSNLKDICEYCNQNKITYVTTLDFLFEALQKQLMTECECNQFIRNVRLKGSTLPDIKILDYTPRVRL
ncbi:hypothetical protein [Dysgonomonas sp. GY617]|uniref:hypothetical protein n=1 Tax=Dysgonomonas sp. GY617 TaxID=2780420 RepID=UPI001883514F|nr:hypothetical protein [Dysgonomonas sp. GY617]MBF0578100.1 hypothetical protein [Dysgonomonas sp. GY617]